MRWVIKLSLLFLAIFPVKSMASIQVGGSVCEADEQEIKPIFQQHPEYPQIASLLCVEGWLQVQFTIGPNGNVLHTQVMDGEPAGVFDSAVDHIKRWYFRPACREGQPVSREAIQRLDFILPPELKQQCPAKIEEQTAALLVELASLYGHLAEQQLAKSIQAVEMPEYEPKFSGDLGLIERFHVNEMTYSLEAYKLDRTQNFASLYYELFDTELLVDDIGLIRTREKLDEFRAGIEAFRQWQIDEFELLFERLVHLRNVVEISPEEFTFLVGRLFGEPTSAYRSEWYDLMDAAAEQDDEIMGKIEAAVTLLDENRDVWSSDSDLYGGLSFQDEEVQEEFRQLIYSIISFVADQYTEMRRMLQFWANES